MAMDVIFLKGLASAYQGLVKTPTTFYYTTDDKQLYLGETKLTNSQEISDAVAKIAKNENDIASITEQLTIITGDGDGSIKKAVADAKTDLENKIGTLASLTTTTKTDIVSAINEVNDAVASSAEAGEVTVEEGASADSARTYTIKQGGVVVGTVSIPKDQVVESGSVVENPSGQTDGKYIELVVTNSTGTGKIYVNVDDLVSPIATGTTAGVVKIGSDFDVASDGTISLYSAMSISSFSNNVNTVEKGRTVSDVTLTWKLNKIPQDLTLDSVAIDANLTSTALTGLGLTSDKTYTLKATDARGASASKTTAIYFRNGRYWGVGTVTNADDIDATFVQGLTKELAANNSKTFTVTAGEGQYIYYACPSSWAKPTFNVGGFDGGFDLIKTFAYTNPSGFTENYDVYKSTNASLGATTVTLKI